MEKQYYKKGLILIYPGYQNEAKQFENGSHTFDTDEKSLKNDSVRPGSS